MVSDKHRKSNICSPVSCPSCSSGYCTPVAQAELESSTGIHMDGSAFLQGSQATKPVFHCLYPYEKSSLVLDDPAVGKMSRSQMGLGFIGKLFNYLPFSCLYGLTMWEFGGIKCFIRLTVVINGITGQLVLLNQICCSHGSCAQCSGEGAEVKLRINPGALGSFRHWCWPAQEQSGLERYSSTLEPPVRILNAFTGSFSSAENEHEFVAFCYCKDYFFFLW